MEKFRWVRIFLLSINAQMSYPGGWASLVVRLGLNGEVEVDWQVTISEHSRYRCHHQGWPNTCGRWGWEGGGGCVQNGDTEQRNLFHRLQWKAVGQKEERREVEE